MLLMSEISCATVGLYQPSLWASVRDVLIWQKIIWNHSNCTGIWTYSYQTVNTLVCIKLITLNPFNTEVISHQQTFSVPKTSKARHSRTNCCCGPDFPNLKVIYLSEWRSVRQPLWAVRENAWEWTLSHRSSQTPKPSILLISQCRSFANLS